MYQEFQKFWEKKWGNPTLIDKNAFALYVDTYTPMSHKKLLDIGCGPGRDSLYFASGGWEVDAFDFSSRALESLRQFAQEKGLRVNTLLGNTLEYSFQEDEYDVIYACNSLHYFSQENTQIIIEKLKKSLKKGGYIFMRVKSVDDVDYGKGEKIGDNFYNNNGDIKYYFSLDFLKHLFSDFEILQIQSVQDNHTKIYGATTINGFIDLIAKK